MSTSESHSGIVLELAEEFLERYRKGQRPSLKEYIDRHPSLAGEIREVFPAMAMMEKIALADESLAGDPTGPAAFRAGHAPEQLGDYRILREIGRGGMGVVYEAEQVSLGRHVALKLLPPQLLRESNQKHRFEREARSAARLHHTNIVPVFGVGEHEETPYYVMQFIRGLGLDEVLGELRRIRAGGEAAAPPGPVRVPSAAAREVSAVSVARSLMTGRFEQADTVDSPPGIADYETPAATLADSPPPRPAPAPGGRQSEPGSPSSSSVSILGPGAGGVGAKQGGRRPDYWQGVARIGVQVADALDYAHKQGIVHRDVKPSNLLLDSRGTVWVTDFGLAKASDQKDLTHTGDILGTLRYMPPEAFDGKSGAPGDVYSLGLTLYELAAFRPAFGERDRGRLVRQVTAAEVERLRKVNPEIPRDLETIVHKAIERDPSHRYASSGELAADLQRFLDDEPIRARRLGRAERLGRWGRRHKAVAALLATLATVLTVGCVVMAVLWSRAEQNAAIARSNEHTAQALATREAKARGEAEAQERVAIERAELLAREDYVNRVNRAYREVQDDNVALAEDLLHGCPPGRRGWEWHHVERLCNPERLILDLGDTSVNALAFGPDGTWAVSGSGNLVNRMASGRGTAVDVWDVRSGRRLRTLPGAAGTVYGVAVSPDGKKVAAGCSAGLVLVWDADTGRAAWSRTEPGLDAMSVAFSPDGRSLAAGYGVYSANAIGRVRFWDVATGARLKAFDGPRGGVNKLAFHPDGRRLAVAGEGVVQVWDLETVAKLHDLEGHRKWVYCLAFSPDGKWLATGGWDRTVKLRDAATGVEALTIFAHSAFVVNLAFSPDGRTLATASEDRSVRLWDVPSGRPTAAFHGHTDFVQAVAFRPDGREIVTGSLDGSVRFWDLETGRPVVVEHTGWVERLAYRRDGLRVLTEAGLFRTDHEATKGWNPLTGEPDAALAGAPFGALPAGFVPGSRFQLRSVTSPDGKLVADTVGLGGGGTASRSKEYSLSAVVIRDAASGRTVHTLIGHSADVVSLAFSPDGRRLATASFDRTIKLWDTQTGQDVFTLRGHSAGLLCLAFSPDGDRIVSGGIDFTARVWDATPFPPPVLAAHDARYRTKIETLAQLKAATDDVHRAEILAGSGQWGLAAEAFAVAVEKEPETLRLRYRLIDALVQSGDGRRVGPACDELVARFGDPSDPMRALGVAGLVRMARLAIDDPEQRRAVHELATVDHDGERAFILAKYGQWDLVTTGLGKAVEEKPDDFVRRCWLLLSLVESGDIRGYRAGASRLVARFGKSTDPLTLNNAAWYCTYAPDAVDDITVPVRMAEAALAGYPASQKRFALNTLGATLYRAGRIGEAIDRLNEGVTSSGGDGVLQDWAFLAMAHFKNGDGGQASKWLEKLRSRIPADNAGFSSDLVEGRILLREAESLMREGGPSPR